MKRLLSIALVAVISTSVLAVPAERIRRQVRLSDGTRIVVTLCGDEHYSWLQTDDGFIVEPVADADCYTLTSLRAADVVPAAIEAEMAKHAPRRIGSQATAPLPSKGSPKIPVVLVQFADSVFHVAETADAVRQYYDLYCNGTRDGNLYQAHGSYGSIRDYFVDQSNGQFTPEFIIIGPVTLDNPESYYGNNKGRRDSGYDEFSTEAIRKATEIYAGDWMDFDNRNKGQVDMVFFIFAGCGENTGGGDGTLWPKETTNGENINGIRFATTACCSEMRARLNGDGEVTSTRPDGIGVMCHELSHALGLPDFYNTNYASFGMDLWSIMDYGCYGSNGYVPCAYTAYEREFMGWQQMETLTEPQWLSIQPIAAGGKGYKIVNAENENEYYVIENRQAVGWDRSICTMGHGLQVTHVDYSASLWSSNHVNNDVKHQRMTIIAANNKYKGTYDSNATPDELRDTWSGNLYPYEQNDSLTALSTPAATVFTAAGYMAENQKLLYIRENEDLTVSLNFGGTDDPDAVDAPLYIIGKDAQDQGSCFDLQGRRVARMGTRGLYIVNGQKYLMPNN